MLHYVSVIQDAIKYLDEDGEGVTFADICDHIADEEVKRSLFYDPQRMRAAVDAALEYSVHHNILQITNKRCTVYKVRYSFVSKKRRKKVMFIDSYINAFSSNHI